MSAEAPTQLSALDGSFLRLESPQAHMHVGFSAIFSAPSQGGRPTVEALRERVASRLPGVPWCRWRLQDAPLGLSEPRWVDDPDFDLAAHVTALARADDRVSHDSFQVLRDSVFSTPLDRSRPLWQISLVPRLEDGRVGMVGKIHHSLVDGFAALQIVGLVLDTEPDSAAEASKPWRPAGPPGTVGWAADGLVRIAGQALGVMRGAAEAATKPRASVRDAIEEIGRVVQATREDLLPRAPDSPLNVPIGARRTLVTYRAPRERLRAARSNGGTLNDVGLAVVTGALRALAIERGDAPLASLKTMIPVSMRKANETGSGNQISMVYIGLPVHLESAPQRLQEVRTQTRRMKEAGRQFGTQTIFSAAGLLPAPVRSPVARLLASPRVFNLTVSQSPAPRGPLHLMGCELEEPYSVVPIAEGHALAIGMVRYQRELFFGCYADPDALPEVRRLPTLLEAEIRALDGAPLPERPDRDKRREDGPPRDRREPEPLPDQVQTDRAARPSAELVAEFAERGAEDGAGPELRIEEPWAAYDEMRVSEIASHLRDATAETVAAVELYERSRRQRKGILEVAERELSRQS